MRHCAAFETIGLKTTTTTAAAFQWTSCKTSLFHIPSVSWSLMNVALSLSRCVDDVKCEGVALMMQMCSIVNVFIVGEVFLYYISPWLPITPVMSLYLPPSRDWVGGLGRGHHFHL